MVMQAIASDLLLWIWIILFALLPKVRGDTCRQVDMRGGGGRGEREKRDRERERERERENHDQQTHVCTQVGGKPMSIFMSARGL